MRDADYHCCLCQTAFRLTGSAPYMAVLEDDGESWLMAAICPDCLIERRDEIEAQRHAYDKWVAENIVIGGEDGRQC